MITFINTIHNDHLWIFLNCAKVVLHGSISNKHHCSLENTHEKISENQVHAFRVLTDAWDELGGAFERKNQFKNILQDFT